MGKKQTGSLSRGMSDGVDVSDYDSAGPLSKRQQKREAREEQEYLKRRKTETPRSRPPSSQSEQAKAAGKGGFTWTFHIVAVLVVILLTLLLKRGEDSYLEETMNSKLLDMNPYEVLGVNKTMSAKEIKKAHRALSLEWHPDRRAGGCDASCHQRFKQINEAYKILGNEEQRVLYDKHQTVLTGSTKAFFTDMKSHEYAFSASTWHGIVKPSLKGEIIPDSGDRRQSTRIWALLVAEPTQEWTEHLLPMWSDFADQFYGRINFMRVDAKHPLAESLLPVKLPLLPAILVLSPHETPHVYEKMMHLTPTELAHWLVKHIPPTMDRVIDPMKLANQINNNGTDEMGRPFVLHMSKKNPAGLMSAIADHTESMFHWIHSDDANILAEIQNLELPEFPSNTKGMLLAQTRNGPVVQALPPSIWGLDKIDLRFRNEDGEIADTKAGKAVKLISSFLKNVTRNNTMPLFEENIGKLCRTAVEDESIVCAVSSKPTWDPSLELEDSEEGTDVVIQHVYISDQHSDVLSSRLKTYMSPTGTILVDSKGLRYKTKTTSDWLPLRKSYRTIVRKVLALPPQPMAPRWVRSWRERTAQVLIRNFVLTTSVILILVALVAFRMRLRRKE